MKKAVIDLGTNTFNLLIAEVEDDNLSILYKTKEAVLLGMGGINDGIITKDAIDRALATLARFAEACDLYQINSASIIGIGTSALRTASNSSVLIDDIWTRFSIKIKIISGNEEAKLIYQGVKWTYNFEEPAVIMDIGGGSSEFILADRTGVLSMASLDIGVSRIYQLLDKSEKYDSDKKNRVVEFMDQQESGELNSMICTTMIGSSGSFETFYEMIHKTKFIPSNKIVELDIESLMPQLDWAINSSLEDRMSNPWIVPIRKTMLPIAALQIKWAIEKLGVKQMLLSSYSLKEGMMR